MSLSNGNPKVNILVPRYNVTRFSIAGEPDRLAKVHNFSSFFRVWCGPISFHTFDQKLHIGHSFAQI